MVKGWRVGEGKVIGGGEADDMGKRGSRSFARADVVWVVVGVDDPPSLVEGGREWPHLPDRVPEVRCDDQGGDEAVCVGEPSDGAQWWPTC
jgi:hypothetical protein